MVKFKEMKKKYNNVAVMKKYQGFYGQTYDCLCDRDCKEERTVQ